MAEIKPCPFCGGSARLRYRPGADRRPIASRVLCDSCEAEGKEFSQSCSYTADKEAIKWWNRRVDAPIDERSKGAWECIEIIDDDGVNDKAAQCSVCDWTNDDYFHSKREYKFCPNCGADMRED